MPLVECITSLKEDFAGKSHSNIDITILHYFQAVFTFMISEEDLLFRHPYLLIGVAGSKIPTLSHVETQSASPLLQG
uniref:Calmodulin-binding heat-shock protein n=1 Tax=Solanum tuberosum TaxID=4113 RepID=M1B9Z4_SOLTU